jgi:hypothetical protein
MDRTEKIKIIGSPPEGRERPAVQERVYSIPPHFSGVDL